MKKFLLSLILLFSLTAAASTQKPLEIDQAFHLSLMAKDNQTLIAEWKIAPTYYLYRARIHFYPANPEATTFGTALMPEGINKTDAELGSYQVYEDELKVIIPIIKSTESLLTLSIEYQGCSLQGYCYPPTKKVIRINLEGDYLQATEPLNIDLPDAHPAQLSKQDRITELLSSEHPLWILLAFFGFGILISLTPCVLPMIPILSSIIMGQKHLSHRHSFLLSLSYVLGMALSYALIGVMFGLMGSSLQTLLQKPAVIIGFSLLFVAMALSLFGFYEIQLPERLSSRLQNISRHQRRGTYAGALVMGMLSTLIVSPCVTAPLVGVLGFISDSGNMVLGGISLFMLGLGMGVPLLIIGTTGHLFLKAGAWMNRIKQLLGLIMLGVAIYLLSRILPAKVIMLFWTLLALSTGLILGALNKAPHLSTKICKALGVLFCVYGLGLAFSLVAGNTNPLHPWVSEKPISNIPIFIPVKTILDVQKQVAAANGKPVLLDFYADWCVACKEMDRNTFSNSALQAELRNWILLRADVTANDEQDRALNNFYQVIAPPTLIMFNSQGKNLRENKLVGEITASELMNHLEGVK